MAGIRFDFEFGINGEALWRSSTDSKAASPGRLLSTEAAHCMIINSCIELTHRYFIRHNVFNMTLYARLGIIGTTVCMYLDNIHRDS
jgi:hypothetical protein